MATPASFIQSSTSSQEHYPFASSAAARPALSVTGSLLSRWESSQKKEDLIAYLDMAIGTQDLATPRAILEKALKKSPDELDLKLILVRFLLKDQEPDQALNLCNKMIKEETIQGNGRTRNTELWVFYIRSHLDLSISKSSEMLKMLTNSIEIFFRNLNLARSALFSIAGIAASPKEIEFLNEGIKKGFPIVELAYLSNCVSEANWIENFRHFCHRKTNFPIELTIDPLINGIIMGEYDLVETWLSLNQEYLSDNVDILFIKALIAFFKEDQEKLETLTEDIEAIYRDVERIKTTKRPFLFLTKNSQKKLCDVFGKLTNKTSTLSGFAHLCFLIGEYTLADPLLKKCLQFYPDEPVFMSMRAVSYAHCNPISELLDTFTVKMREAYVLEILYKSFSKINEIPHRLEKLKEFDILRFNRALVLSTYHRDKEALEAMEDIASTASVHKLRGDILVNLKDFHEAFKEYTLALPFDRKDVSVWLKCARTLKEIFLFQTELNYLDEALKLCPNDLTIQLARVENLIKQNRVSEAWTEIVKIESSTFNSSRTLKLKFATAIACLKKVNSSATPLKNESTELLANQQSNHFYAGQAYAIGKQLISEDPHFLNEQVNVLNVALAAFYLGRHDEAEVYLKSLGDNISSPVIELETMATLFKIYAHKNDKEALVYINKLCELSPIPGFFDLRVRTLLSLREYGEAKKYLLQSSTIANKQQTLDLLDSYARKNITSEKLYKEVLDSVPLFDKLHLKRAKRILMYRARERNFSEELTSKIDLKPLNVTLSDIRKFLFTNKKIDPTRVCAPHPSDSFLSSGIELNAVISAKIETLSDTEAARLVKYLLLGENISVGVKNILEEISPQQFQIGMSISGADLKEILKGFILNKCVNADMEERLRSLIMPDGTSINTLLDRSNSLAHPIWKEYSYNPRRFQYSHHQEIVDFLLQEPRRLEMGEIKDKSLQPKDHKFKKELEVFKSLMSQRNTKGAMMSLYIMIQLHAESGVDCPNLSSMNARVKSPLEITILDLLEIEFFFA